MKRFLHVGCGPKHQDATTPGFHAAEWEEVRLDIDPAAQPDIVGTMTDMHDVSDGSVDAVFSSHNIEHLYPHEVPVALAEFRRVLAPNGFVVITCPDLRAICELVAQDKLTEPAYVAPAGPVAPIDVLYGYRPSMARGNLFMAHRCGFTEKVLIATLRAAGFATVISMRRGAPAYDLWAAAVVEPQDAERMRELAARHLPVAGARPTKGG